MGSTAEHQQLLQETALLIQKNYPNAFFIPRTIGLFTTSRNTKIQIGQTGQADAYILMPAQINNTKFQIHIELEFKTGNATQSKDQKKWENSINSRNGLYLLVRNAEDILTIINKNYGHLIAK